MKNTILAASAIAFTALTAQSQDQRVRVALENLAPAQGTFLTPVWVAFHDGGFDLYDQGLPANGPNALVPNDALERIAEDGNTSVLATEFLAGGTGLVEATVPGPAGPIAPGQRAGASFLLDPLAATSHYLSYAAMVLPSNDAFIANGDPLSIPVFDGSGQFVAPNVFDLGAEVLDAGSEVNDELPANTAFFGQATPDTGVVEGGVVMLHPGFNPRGSGGILDDPRFAQGDFAEPGYPVAKIRITSAPAITELREHRAFLTGNGEVPPVATTAIGVGTFRLTDDGTKVRYVLRFRNLSNVVGAHLHMGPIGQNGPIVVDLIDPANLDSNPFPLAPGGGAFEGIAGTFDAAALAGPLFGQPLDALSGAMEANQIYVNVHTSDGQPGDNTGPGDFISGEVRGLVRLL